jgi:hypothetical protein
MRTERVVGRIVKCHRATAAARRIESCIAEHRALVAGSTETKPVASMGLDNAPDSCGEQSRLCDLLVVGIYSQ